MPPEKSGRRLGRGLDALFNSAASREQPLPDTQLRDLPITAISPNPFQPRKEFSETELRELQESISTNGLLQPVTVRATPGGKGFELVAEGVEVEGTSVGEPADAALEDASEDARSPEKGETGNRAART